MHILINASFWHQPTVGTGQYLHGLVRWLPQVAPQHRYTLLLPAAAETAPPPPPEVRSLVLRTPFDGRNANLAKLWFEQVSVPVAARLIAGHAPTLLHVPYFAPPLRVGVPLITTVGDIIPLRLPEYRGGPHVRLYMALVQQAVRQSNHIMTFSAFSGSDLERYLHIPARSITPTRLAAAECYCAGDRTAAIHEVAERYGVRGPFVYYVGGLDARKNVATLLHAWAQLGATRAGWELVIAGKALGKDRRLFPDYDTLIGTLGIGASVRRIQVSHADGPLLYRACSIFAFPSRYEGFGLPPLEAMACGAPVITSNASSLPEVVGAAAYLVEPDYLRGWVNALGTLISHPADRADLTARGYRQAARFSWQRVAEETAAVYARNGGTGED